MSFRGYSARPMGNGPAGSMSGSRYQSPGGARKAAVQYASSLRANSNNASSMTQSIDARGRATSSRTRSPVQSLEFQPQSRSKSQRGGFQSPSQSVDPEKLQDILAKVYNEVKAAKSETHKTIESMQDAFTDTLVQFFSFSKFSLIINNIIN